MALIAVYKRWVVMGWQYLAIERERDEWKAMALDGLKTTSELAVAAKRHTILTPEQADAALRIISEAGL